MKTNRILPLLIGTGLLLSCCAGCIKGGAPKPNNTTGQNAPIKTTTPSTPTSSAPPPGQ
ncbi:MAG TPA: hypothetical protein VHV83_01990 [Armatimonadota bacterium]|nr:hypothetical protein [Armatimonadota bacterium]